MDVRAYFKEENDTVYFTGVYMELFIPKYYFDDKVALRIGAEIETLGIFNFKIFDNLCSKWSLIFLIAIKVSIKFKVSYFNKISHP